MFRALHVAVVIPAFNERRAIATTVRTLPSFVDAVIVVDDASRDDTSEQARATDSLRSDSAPLYVLRHPATRGVGAAIATGYRQALALGADVVVVMGGDGQMDPADLPALLAPIADGSADYVKGNRFRHREIWRAMPVTRLAGNLLLSTATKITSGYRHVFDSQCGYTAIHRDMLARLPLDDLWARYGYPNDLLARLHTLGARVVDVPVKPIYGEHWKSGINLRTVVHPIPWVLLRSWGMRLAARRENGARPHSSRPGNGARPHFAEVGLRIGVVTTSYPRFVGDPAGGFVAGHVAALRALGHRVEVIASGDGVDRADRIDPLDASGDRVGRVLDASGDRAGRIDPLDAPGASLLARRISDQTLFYRGGAPDLLEAAPLRGAIAAARFTARLTLEVARRAHRWDSIITHWLVPSAIAALPTKLPMLAIAHGGDIHTLRRLGLLAPTLYALRARDARLAFVSEELRSIARAAAPQLARWLDGAIVQPMGIAIDHFRAIPRAPLDPPTIVIASRLVPVKGIDVAIAAMAHVRAPVRLVIAGDGPARAALTRLAHDDRPLARIAFLGAVPTSERDQLLRGASMVIVPSRVLPSGRSEGTPTIALEALAAGVPVIASDVGGLSALPAIQLVPPEDPRALAAAIDRTLADPPPASWLRAAVEHLDWNRVVANLR
jgi:glycosyltransferase involved in cell wall biosynthesis